MHFMKTLETNDAFVALCIQGQVFFVVVVFVCFEVYMIVAYGRLHPAL